MGSLLPGIRVIELTTMITGSLAGMMLADLGADVVKVENPEGGDPFRSFRGGLYSPHFCAYNRNKRSVALDLRAPDGKAALQALIAASDVLIVNFRPGVLERLGFTDARLAEINPRLIACHISGFGAGGPYAHRPAYDAVAQALSGMSSLFLDPEEPRIAGPTVSDNVTGHYACYGILGALLARERTGEGRRVDVNMLESTLAFMPDPFGYYTQLGIVSDPQLRARTSQSYAFRCGDGRLVAIHLSSQEKFWRQFVDLVGLPELLEDPLCATRSLRLENYEHIRRLAAPVFGGRELGAWLDALAETDLPYAPVYGVEEVLDDPQVRHLGSFVDLSHPEMGPLKAIRRPVLYDGSRDDQPQAPPPMLGEHTKEVLSELGMALVPGVAP
ncbi:formyl-CoA transferase [Roseomonas rosea]|jgi:crotonobetainyl-CoA:carnitine CoA-transferase CaiB-like acyl-CoA transferase|uniref:Formyl-CoA transferase n=1 Tax=Muricoccus roseus TaxID=198092 RepID=A0A1M6N395_9PROT|nr:CoA transferase [Roseomonas rosea]SHJ90156.1 formyl-CoA transferase [Roseomonas rosea]